MTTLHAPVVAFPPFVSAALRPLPLHPLQFFLSAVLRRIVRQHPRMFERLGHYAGKRYGLAPSDLPFGFVLDTAPVGPGIAVVRSLPAGLDATISGPLQALLGMASGAYDGDALFFSRTIVVEGDIEAVLALRNAIDDAGVDILREGTALLGPLGRLGEALLRHQRRGDTGAGNRKRQGASSWN
ncbi:ubiquinone anaerobic biosynthesis accessory factor UbiT [Microvirga terricola]|uniref:Sterol-binding protein n=1 Tax=Microvirga terricola TaxID=2719797 RepID=A0ABX0VC19_9HYPH|nr:SCP2 sterol-binding domain-containing protein [Microvirga terricola]NIX75916.1 sterol-binding protein [Microvirga terricola]